MKKKLSLLMVALLGIVALATASWRAPGDPVTIYSWESPDGTVFETGGTAVHKGGKDGDPNRVNFANASYYTICLNGKSDFSTDYIQVDLAEGKTLHKGDIISITAYRNKNDNNKQSGALLNFEKGGSATTAVDGDLIGLEFVNIDSSEKSTEDKNRGIEPNTINLTVPDEAEGSTYFKMSRAITQTNLFITKLVITSTEKEEQGGETTEPNYYVAGNMTEWKPNAEYKLTRNTAATDVEEYMIDLTLKANDEFKVAKSDDGETIADTDWYPSGMDNNYTITADGDYTVYFRPKGDGGDGWYYGVIYVAAKAAPAPAFRDIKADLTSTALIPEGAAQWDDVSTGISVAEDGTLSRVAKDDADIIFNGKWHGTQYGWANFSATVKVQGCVKITAGQTNVQGKDMIVKIGDTQVANLNTAGNLWSASNPTENIAVTYYRTNEPATLTFEYGSYLPYFAVEAIDPADIPAEVTNYNITFAAGEGAGEAPKALEIEAGQKFNAPKNYYLYKEGSTLTGWNDGTKTYAIDEEITPEADMTLTAVYTANEVSLADRTVAVTLTFPLNGYNDNPQYKIEKTTGIIVTQATVNGKTIDVKADVDATNGKFVANNGGWHQVNANTKVTVPSAKDAVISVTTYNDATSVNFNGAAGTAEGYTATFTAIADDATVEISQVSNNYWNNLTITLPAPAVSEANYYVVGNMTEWKPNAEYKLTRNTAAEGEEYTIKLNLTTADQFKVAKSDDGTTIADSDWFPSGMGNNYGENGEITADGEYTIYFRPNADGGDDWFYNVIYVAANTPVAQDVTATWDFAGNCAGLAPKSEGGAYTAETMASNVEGIEMTIAYNGGSIKNNDNSYQVTTGVVMNIPVKSAGDLITVKGYPGYSKYTIGNNTEELTGDNEYKAKNSDAEAGYVAVTSKDGNNYYLSISVTQYAPQEPTTLVNEPATATFPFNEGTEDQKATFSNADYFLNSKVSHGEGVVLEGKDNKGLGQTWFNPVAKDAAAAESNAIRFMIQPKPGFTFTPTKVSFKSTRFGTNGGKLDIAWQNADKTTVTLATGINPNRDNATPNVSELSYDVTGSTPGEGACGLLINLYSLDPGKHVGFTDIVIEGVLNGTEKDVPILASFTLNGIEYQVEDVFGDAYEATFELSKKDEMVGTENPLTNITATSGEVGTVTYNGDATHCVVTIPVTAGETTLDYVLNVVQKPDFTLTYLNTDGTEMGTQTIEKDATIGEFAIDYTTATAGDGYKVRGWFERATGGRKFTVEDVITADQTLYAVATEIEVASDSKKYVFNLTDPLFYAEDHEAFNPAGEGYYFHDTTHGWAFKNGNTVDLLVGPKATINVTVCQYGSGTGIVVKKGEEVLETLAGKSDADGGIVSYNYEGEAGTITLEMQCGGEMYIHSITIFNTSSTNYDQQGDWLIVKQGDVSSFLDAIEVAKGMDNAKVFLPDGTYDLGEAVLTSVGGTNVSLIGQSTEKTIIKNTPPVSKEGLMSAATLVNGGNNFYMQDLTLQNELDYYSAGSAGRANAFHDTGNHTICKNVCLLSYQDTYLSPTDKQLYWEDSEIHGTVDYLCGGSDVYFNRVKLVNESRKKDQKSGEATITAHQPRTAEKFGYVFNECVVENNAASYNFGRAWGGASGATARPMAVYLNTTLNQPDELVATRFTLKGMNTQAGLFHEYNSKDANGDVVSPASLVETFTNNTGADALTYDIILSSEEAANYALSNVFTDWQPNVIATQLEAPIAEYENGVITITPADNGAIAYLIEKNGEFVGITAEFTYTIGEIANGDELTIRAANTRGGFGEPKVVSKTATSIKAVNAAIERGEQVIFNLSGQRVNKATRGIYIINGRKTIVK